MFLTFLENKNLATISILLALVAIIALEYIIFFILLVIFIFCIKHYGKNLFIPFVFIILVAVPSSLGEEIRLIAHLISFIIIILYFLYLYGLNFNSFPIPPKSIVLIVFLYLFSIIISTLHSEYYELGITHLIRSLIFFSLVYLFFSFLKSELEVKIFLNSLIIVSVIFSLLLFVELYRFNLDLINFNQGLMIGEGEILFHKNALGAFYSITILLLLSLALNPIIEKKKKRVFIVILMFFVAGLITTNSRAAILSVSIGSFFLLYKINKKYIKYVIIYIILFFSLFFFESINEKIQLFFRIERLFTGRDSILLSTFQVISDNLIFGAGPGATKFEMYKNIPYLIGTPEERFLYKYFDSRDFGHAHNFYLFLFSDLGILGLMISIYLPIAFLKVSFSTLKKVNHLKDQNYYLLLGLIAAGISFFIRGFFEWGGILSYGMISNDLPFWWIFIMIMYYHKYYLIEKNTISYK